MTQRAPILFCDHSGERSEAIGGILEALGYPVSRSGFLRRSLEELAGREVIVVDPLARAGQVEILALDRARGSRNGDGEGPREDAPALLIVGERELSGLIGRTGLTGGPWDVIRDDATTEEWRLRLGRLEAERQRLARVRDLAHRASHDDLTGLLRKDAFQDRLQEHFSAAHRHHFELALVLLDLDDFGQVNKVHDHVVGDRIIGSVGEVIRRALRTEDVAGRLGGDEFAILLPYTGKMDASAVVNRVRDAIAKLSGRFPGANADIRVGSSIGFETFDGVDIESLEDLRLHAERALRAAKERGGNQGVYFRSLD